MLSRRYSGNVMQIYRGLKGLHELAPHASMTIGNFDGLHLGHSSLISAARALRDAAPGSRLVVVTFEPHPLTVLRPDRVPAILTPAAQKHALFEAMGVDDLVELAPTPDVLEMSAEAFWTILRDDIRVKHLIEGDAFNFGKDRGGTIDRLREWSARSDVTLHIVKPIRAALCNMLVVDISSTLVRWLVGRGRVRDAAICLGRSYALQGTVARGFQRGRTIGVPTANLQCLDPKQLVPAEGVYAGNAIVDGESFPAAISVGRIPTFTENVRQIEAHLIDVRDVDLYGKTIEIEFMDWIREQRRYSSIEMLKEQLAIDIDACRERSGVSNATLFTAGSLS